MTWPFTNESQILLFALILLRMIGFVLSSAIFSLPAVSVQLKILFSVVLTMLIAPSLSLPGNMGFGEELPLLAAREVLVGLTLGFLTRLFFFAISMMGDIVAISMGLNSAQLYNPMMGSTAGVFDQLFQVFGVMFFLLLGGHHLLITGLFESFATIKVGVLSFNVGTTAEIVLFGQDLLVLTVKMSAPVLVSILIANMAMGILGRAIPQLNVLVTSFPVTIMLGLGVLILSLPLFVTEMNGLLELTSNRMFQVIRSL